MILESQLYHEPNHGFSFSQSVVMFLWWQSQSLSWPLLLSVLPFPKPFLKAFFFFPSLPSIPLSTYIIHQTSVGRFFNFLNNLSFPFLEKKIQMNPALVPVSHINESGNSILGSVFFFNKIFSVLILVLVLKIRLGSSSVMGNPGWNLQSITI